MRKPYLAVPLAAALAAGQAPVVALAADSSAPIAADHKAGTPGFGVNLPGDVKMKTADGKTVTHPCAGRKLAYQSREVPLYAANDTAGKLAVMALDGTEVTNQDDLCFRLAPDADDKGQDLTRMVIPEDLSFLGTPGDTVWVAPATADKTIPPRPMSTGIGAFDSKRMTGDDAVPTNFRDNQVRFEMTDFQGPEGGDVHIYFKNKVSPVVRVLSTTDEKPLSFAYNVGKTNQFSWAFTKPGIYAIQWQARATLDDGSETASDKVTQYWLVGDDPSVGLPKGTTKNLNEVKAAPQSPTTPAETTGKPTTTATQVSTSAKPSETAVPAEPSEPEGETKLTASGHKHGNTGLGVNLPADQKAEGGSQPHVCAGRKLVYQSHNDALYGTRMNGDKLTVMAVDGQQVVPMDSLCFRLPRDADSTGREISRTVITEDTAFLGKPGQAVWLAPQATSSMDKWRPLWSGLGAFDRAHEPNEEAIPSNFKDNLMFFDLVDYKGPGEMQIFFHRAWKNSNDRYFSSADENLHSVPYKVGAHGHFNWTFTEPGIYEITWQGRAEHKDGTTEKTEPVTQYWLVGEDSDVGLPKGTTINLNEVKTYVDGKAPETTAPETTAPESEAPVPAPDGGNAQLCYAAQALSTKPDAFITSGHMDLALAEDDGEVQARLYDDSDVHHPAVRESGTFLFEVPDSAKQEIPKNLKDSFLGDFKQVWMLPQAQVSDLPWLGFSTTALKSDTLAEGTSIKVSLSDVTGPGRIVTWHENVGRLDKELDSADPASHLTYGFNDHDHQAFGFSEPGLYAATFLYTGTARDGGEFKKELRATFAVGDEAIGQARKYKNEGYSSLPAAGEGCASAPGDETGDGPDDEPATPGAGVWEKLAKAIEKLAGAVLALGGILGGGKEPTQPQPPVSPSAPIDTVTTTSDEGSVQQAIIDGLRELENSFIALDNDAGPLFQQLVARDGAEADQGEDSPEGAVVMVEDQSGAAQPAEQPAAPSGGQAPAQQPATQQPAQTVSGGSSGSAPAISQPAAVATGGTETSVGGGESVEGGEDVEGGEVADDLGTVDQAAPEDSLALGGGGGIVSSIDGNSPEKSKAYDAASAVTAGGFWAGLAFGLGAMALIGGIVLFVAAWRALKQVRSGEDDLAPQQAIG